jgi:succinate dehydrogenase/fumarate reductase flavoprotein subunit
MIGERTADVVIVGIGAAGMAAAITAHDLGAEVLVLEKTNEAESGGNTRVSGNVWFNPTDRDEAIVYYRSLADPFPVDVELAAAWADEVCRNTAWVETLGGPTGLTSRPYEHPDLAGHECDDGHHHVGEAWGDSRLWNRLREAVRERGIEVAYETRARQLLQEPGSAEVVGVCVETRGALRSILARRGVVLASGGFANDPALARDFLRLPGSHPWGAPASTGDGLRMAMQAGADLAHVANYMGRPGLRTPEHRAAFPVTFYDSHGFINVADDGRRFLREDLPLRHGKVREGGRLRLFPERMYCGIFDEATRRAGPIVARRDREPFGWNTIIEGYQWSDDNLLEIERGWIARADTPRGLAAELGIDGEGLEAEIEAYNRCCHDGRDASLGRSPETLVALEEPPFYGYRWAPMLVFTCGGPRKDARAGVLDPQGTPIPGLYCAGEVSSSYGWAMSGGQMIGDAMAFGRIAGRSVASRATRDESRGA